MEYFILFSSRSSTNTTYSKHKMSHDSNAWSGTKRGGGNLLLEKKNDPIKDFIKDEVEDLFTRLDVSGKGYLNMEDIQAAYTQMGMQYSAEMCTFIVEEFDSEGEGNENIVVTMFNDILSGVVLS